MIKTAVWKRLSQQVFKDKKWADSTPMFNTIALETRTRCNSKCSFCAASILTDKREDLYMPDALIDKIIVELKQMDYTGRFVFFINNEPLMDARLVEMIGKVKAELPKAISEVHTNGLKLNPRTGRELLEAGLDVLIINNYTQKNEMISGVKKFLEEVAPEFPDVEIEYYQRLVEEQLANRGGTAPNAILPQKRLDIPCFFPFEYLGITADGRVSICCQDHYFEEVMGNINTQSLADIWYGEKFKKHVLHFLKEIVPSLNFVMSVTFAAIKMNI